MFLWEFCVVYIMWCLSTKTASESGKGTTRYRREFILRHFDGWFFFSRKISVVFEIASLLFYLVGDGGKAKINFVLFLDIFFICLIYDFWFYKGMFDIKKTPYLIIIHPTSIFRIKNKMQYKKYSLYLHPMKMFLFASNCFFNSLFLATTKKY